MNINTEVDFKQLKKQVNANNELKCYLVDCMSVPLEDCNRNYIMVLVWIEQGGIVEGAYTQEELDKQASDKALRDSKNIGEPYITGGENISFTSDDAVGMLQVKTAFELGVTETNIEFRNGTILNIKSEDFIDFAKWFSEKRNSFFI